MKLIKFSVERFRSIVSSSFNVADKTVIVGANNEGKSNLLRALVIALRELETIARDDRRFRKERKLLIYERKKSYFNNMYRWDDDYPIKYQITSGDKEMKRSKFRLDFLLDESEFSDFRNLTKSNFKDNIIPIKLEISPNNVYFTLSLRGHFYKNATGRKMAEIAKFITSKISVCYIDAFRSAETAEESISRLLHLQMKKVEEKDEFAILLHKLRQLYQSELDEMSSVIGGLLNRFLPNIGETHINANINTPSLSYLASRRQLCISINDGVTTQLRQKGSGVQSLVALFLAHYISTTVKRTDNFILVVDEPESHLHPKAIHELKDILIGISRSSQVVISTHSPILVDAAAIGKNIIVQDNVAHEAATIHEVRESLGVNLYDNLYSAELVVVVEGATDENVLKHLICLNSTTLKEAISSNRLVVTSTGGTHKMKNFIKLLRSSVYKLHVVVDGDNAGLQELNDLIKTGIIENNEYNFLRVPGISNSELENMIKPLVYADAINKRYGLSLKELSDLKKSNVRWTDAIKQMYELSGKIWSEETGAGIKKVVSESILKCSEIDSIIIDRVQDVFNKLCDVLEERVSNG